MHAQAQLDMMEAQMKGAMGMQRAEMKAAAQKAQTTGQNIDAGIQARMDAAAQGQEEPVGPQVNVAPLPNASQPSQGMGTGGVDLNALLQQPGAIEGGAGVQQATGGMGRAEPSGVNPQQLQSQVSPYNVSQRTTERTVPMQYPGFIANTPQVTRETVVEPNQLTPYQLGQLQQGDARLQAERQNYADLSNVRWEKLNLEQQRTLSQVSKNAAQERGAKVLAQSRYFEMGEKQKDRLQKELTNYGEPLANLYAMALEGRIGKDELAAREQNILGSIQNPDARQAVKEFAERTLATVQATRSLKGTGLAVQTSPDGSTTIVQGDAGAILGNVAERESNTQQTLAFRRLQAGLSGQQQLDEFLNIVAPGGQPDPTLLGSGGSITKASTKIIGSVVGLVPKIRTELEDDIKKDLNRSLSDPNISPQEKQETIAKAAAILEELKSGLNPYQPKAIGAIGVMVNAMRATLVRGELGGELNIRGYEALGPDFLDPTGIKSAEGAYEELLSLRKRFEQNANLGRADYERMGGDRRLTSRQIIGLDPMPTLNLEGPEVLPSDIFKGVPSGTGLAPSRTPTKGPQVIPKGSAKGKVWDPSELR